MITAIRLYLSVAENRVALRLWAKEFTKQGAEVALTPTLRHLEPCSTGLTLMRAYQHKYAASAEWRHPPYTNKIIHSFRWPAKSHEMSPLTTKSNSDANGTTAVRRQTLDLEFRKWADSHNLSELNIIFLVIWPHLSENVIGRLQRRDRQDGDCSSGEWYVF